ncbi:hypothetical protein EYC84_003269 [Monilinia fructicola]|uniref:Uncharacterized protein n=1 Tax=Monilinia fructicola TaxID=38448 RepID=A0A5M9K193_MONFR|nr:hypothetical protein EYC84_003269 [Monilinia fructicola]
MEMESRPIPRRRSARQSHVPIAEVEKYGVTWSVVSESTRLEKEYVTNCGIDGIQCLVPGSKRRRSKRGSTDTAQPAPLQVYADGAVNPQHISNDDIRRLSGASTANSLEVCRRMHLSMFLIQSINQLFMQRKQRIDGQRLAQLTNSASMTGDWFARDWHPLRLLR